MPADSANRTLVLSVVAVDLVGYSRKPVAEQMSLKDKFNQLLLAAIHDIPVADRIILDTGDGVAMGFLGDPEDALYVAMFMHDANNRDAAAIRIGINLGPVKLATGIGGHPNIIGDGINVAERIMTFAEPGELTASRPFFEIMSRMSDHYTSLFQFAGVRTDKQVRAHDVYLVGKSAAAFQQAEQGVKERAAQRAGQVAISSMPTAPSMAAAVVSPKPTSVTVPSSPALSDAMVERHSGLIDFLEDRKKVGTTAALLAVVAVSLGATLAYRMTQTIPRESTTPVVAALSPAPASADVNPVVRLPSPIPAVNLPSPTPTPTPAPAAAAKGAAIVLPPKVETKPVPVTNAPAATAAPPPAAKPATQPVAVVPSPVRDQPKDAKAEKPERGDRTTVKTPPPRPSVEREQSAPVTAAPVVPAYQAPLQAPRTESVAPTPAPSQPAPVIVSTEAIVVSRSAPPFPIEGVRQGLQAGFVKARMTIDARGNVSNVEILESRPITAFGRETRLTLKDWKFNPGTPNRTYDIELSFKL